MFVIFRSLRTSLTPFSVLKNKNLLFRHYFTMKLYTDKYNPFTLRVLVADKLAGTSVSVEHVRKNEAVERFSFLKEPKLPFLEVEHNRHIFSPNAICRYLLSCSASKKFTSDLNNLAVEDHWLEWDVLHLQPSIFSFLVASFSPGGGSVETNLVTECLSHLESALNHKGEYIVGNELSLVDVVIWGTLYPLLMQDSHQGLDLNIKYPKVMAWFGTLMQENDFSSISRVVTEGKGPKVFQDALLSYNFVTPVLSTWKDSSKSEVAADTLESDEVQRYMMFAELDKFSALRLT